MSKDEPMSCPFCGGKCDPEGWLDGNGRRGPECESCGATADSVSAWNRRVLTTRDGLLEAAGICEENAKDCDVMIAKNLANGDKKTAEAIKREKSAHLQDAQRIRAAAAKLPQSHVVVPVSKLQVRS